MATRALEFVPPAYCAVMHRRHPEWRTVDRSADLVIEGYQSSGNTFARMAAEYTNPGLDVASHVHSWAHVAQARLVGKPVVVLLRDPEDAISSHVVRMELADVDHELRRYRTFYRGVWPLRSQVVLAPFEMVTTRFGDVVDAVNRRYGTSFRPFDHHDPAATEAIFEQMEREMASIGAQWRVARPRPERQAATEAVRESLREVERGRALAGCRAAYERLLGLTKSV
jgi:hypothetical protein